MKNLASKMLSGLLALLVAKGLDMQLALRPFSCGWGLLDALGQNSNFDKNSSSDMLDNNTYTIYIDSNTTMLVMGALACASGQYGVYSCSFCPTGTYSTGLGVPTVAGCSGCAVGQYGGTTGLTVCVSCAAGTLAEPSSEA